jgi:hypothetical protein
LYGFYFRVREYGEKYFGYFASVFYLHMGDGDERVPVGFEIYILCSELAYQVRHFCIFEIAHIYFITF